MTAPTTATRVQRTDGQLLARCEPCDQTLRHVECFDSDVALGTFFQHHPASEEAVHHPELPAGWQAEPA